MRWEHQNNNADLRYLDPLGRRLLSKNEKDWDVQWYLLYALRFWADHLNECMALAKQSSAKFPNQPRSHYALAEAYNGLFISSAPPNVGFAQKAVDEYNAFLASASTSDPLRKNAALQAHIFELAIEGKIPLAK